MARPEIDLQGRIFERLTVVERLPSEANGSHRWLCRCTCGDRVKTRGSDLLRGNTRSCGCLRIEVQRARMVALNENRRLA